VSVFELTDADRAAAAEHVRFAEREAAKTGLPADTPLRPVDQVAVIGAGTMGGGIAMALANAGLPVVLVDADAAALERGLQRVRANYDTSVQRGKLTPEAVAERMARIRGTNNLADAGGPDGADLFIEAVFEDMALKQRLFRELDAIAKAGAILATNTSGLDINEIAAATRRPQDVVGAHFFSPANVMRLLEVVRTDATAADVVVTLMALGRRIGKVAVLARIWPGFIGNALFRQYNRDAHFLVEDGALPHEVDATLTKFGYAMGIFAVHDMAGNDVGYPTRKAQMATRPTDRRWNDLILKLVEMGRLGQKSGQGWYRYEAGDRRPQRDPELEAWIVEESARMGISAGHRRGGDPGALPLRHGQRRRAAAGARHCIAAQRHRHRLPDRLRLSRRARRADGHGRPHRPAQGAGRHPPPARRARLLVAARAAAGAAGGRGAQLCGSAARRRLMPPQLKARITTWGSRSIRLSSTSAGP
jgi:3-hydroxyacyl-CoA dehydrogenase